MKYRLNLMEKLSRTHEKKKIKTHELKKKTETRSGRINIVETLDLVKSQEKISFSLVKSIFSFHDSFVNDSV